MTETVGGTTEPEKPVEPEKPTEPEKPVEPEKPETVTKTYGTVTYDYLNIRANAGANYKLVGKLNKGDRVEVLETKKVSGNTWARIERGWICITGHARLDTVIEGATGTEKPVVQTGTITASCLNIRSGAGTNNAVVGYLYKGASVTILEKKTVNGDVWARIDKGWISMQYVA